MTLSGTPLHSRGGGRTPPSERRRKRHHYLPQSYLAAWADQDGRLAVRRRSGPNVFVASTSNVAVEANLYTLYYGAYADDSLEVAFSEIEADIPEQLERLRQARAPRRGTQERRQFAELLALQYVRTPDAIGRVLFSTIAREATGEYPISQHAMRAYLTELYGEEPESSEVQGACDYANFDQRIGAPTKSDAIGMLLKIAAEHIAPKVAAKAWRVEISRQRQFVTTDRPIVNWQTNPSPFGGLGFDDAHEIRFPLGPQHLLVLDRGSDERYIVDSRRVLEVNRHLAHSCHQTVVGHPAEQAELRDLALRPVGPTMRYNTGPAYERGADGQLQATGKDILHMYSPPDDGWLDRYAD